MWRLGNAADIKEIINSLTFLLNYVADFIISPDQFPACANASAGAVKASDAVFASSVLFIWTLL